jgi:hypothetical protein
LQRECIKENGFEVCSAMGSRLMMMLRRPEEDALGEV